MSAKKRVKRSVVDTDSNPSSKPSIHRERDGAITLNLSAGGSLLFNGYGKIQVDHGVLDINGFQLTSDHPPLMLCADPDLNDYVLITALPSSEEKADAVATAVVKEMSESNMSEGPGPPLPCHVHEAAAVRSFKSLPPQWEEAAHLLAGAVKGEVPLVVVVCGNKNVGKSTFGRWLVNRLLTVVSRVAYLDTDCGQPEFTPCGLVSLHWVEQPVFGQPHLHPRQPLTARFIGDTSPKSDPRLYLLAIQDLVRRYHEEEAVRPGAAHTPLVVNTHGWVKGTGLDLMAQMLTNLQPSHLVNLQSSTTNRDLPEGVFWDQKGSGCHRMDLPGIGGMRQDLGDPTSPSSSTLGALSDGETRQRTPSGRSITSSESRTLLWLQWARQCVGCEPGWGQGWGPEAAEKLAIALAEHPPYQVPLGCVRVEALHGEIPLGETVTVLNGAVVGLMGASNDPMKGTMSKDVYDRSFHDSLAPCLGLGLVRGVDTAKKLLYVLTSVPPGQLPDVSALRLGRLELPSCLLSGGPYWSPYQALFCLPLTGTGAGTIKSRNNLLRNSLAATAGS